MTTNEQLDIQSLSHSSNHSSNSNHNVYVQIATPKSPTSDGFSPQHITELHNDHSIENEIKQKLADEIDVEILLKHREYSLIQKEIAKVESQLDTLTKVHDDPDYVKYVETLIQDKTQAKYKPVELIETSSNSWVPSIRKSSLRNQSADSDSSPPKQHRTSYGGLRPVIDANGNKICVHKRSDGVIVRIDCPSCGRTDFGSAQGFLNHARLAHQIEYKSQDHAALMCGRCLESSEQDEVGNSSIKKLKELKMDPDRNLAPGVVIDDGPQLKKKRKSSSKNEESSGFLEKLYNENNHGGGDFKELINDVTMVQVIEMDEADSSDIADASSSIISKNSSNFKKSHNRRKSRGGLSAVTFDESSFENRPSSSTDVSAGTENSEIEEFNSSNTAIVNDQLTEQDYNKLTPAQRRRVPTIPNSLRTRSRSSRENSK